MTLAIFHAYGTAQDSRDRFTMNDSGPDSVTAASFSIPGRTSLSGFSTYDFETCLNVKGALVDFSSFNGVFHAEPLRGSAVFLIATACLLYWLS